MIKNSKIKKQEKKNQNKTKKKKKKNGIKYNLKEKHKKTQNNLFVLNKKLRNSKKKEKYKIEWKLTKLEKLEAPSLFQVP